MCAGACGESRAACTGQHGAASVKRPHFCSRSIPYQACKGRAAGALRELLVQNSIGGDKENR